MAYGSRGGKILFPIPDHFLRAFWIAAAKSLSISERTLFSLRKAGAIRAVKVGPVGLRFSIAELQRFIAEREAESVVAESDGAA